MARRKREPFLDRLARELAELIDADARVLARELETIDPPSWKRMSRRELANLWLSLPPEGHALLQQAWPREAYERALREAQAQIARDWALRPYLEAYGA
jgi:hypothetical protein